MSTYRTEYHGSPYGEGGEKGEDATSLHEAAKMALGLRAGQRMRVYDDNTHVVAEWACQPDGEVYEVCDRFHRSGSAETAP